MKDDKAHQINIKEKKFLLILFIYSAHINFNGLSLTIFGLIFDRDIEEERGNEIWYSASQLLKGSRIQPGQGIRHLICKHYWTHLSTSESFVMMLCCQTYLKKTHFVSASIVQEAPVLVIDESKVISEWDQSRSRWRAFSLTDNILISQASHPPGSIDMKQDSVGRESPGVSNPGNRKRRVVGASSMSTYVCEYVELREGILSFSPSSILSLIIISKLEVLFLFNHSWKFTFFLKTSFTSLEPTTRVHISRWLHSRPSSNSSGSARPSRSPFPPRVSHFFRTGFLEKTKRCWWYSIFLFSSSTKSPSRTLQEGRFCWLLRYKLSTPVCDWLW